MGVVRMRASGSLTLQVFYTLVRTCLCFEGCSEDDQILLQLSSEVSAVASSSLADSSWIAAAGHLASRETLYRASSLLSIKAVLRATNNAVLFSASLNFNLLGVIVVVAATLLALCICFRLLEAGVDPLSDVIRIGLDDLGPSFLGTDIDIDYVNVSVFRGWIDLRGLVVKNPPGYQSATLLTAGRIFVDLDTQKFLGKCCSTDHLTVETVEASDVELTLETKGWGCAATSNLQDILARLETDNVSTGPPQSSQSLDVHRLKVSKVRAWIQADQLNSSSFEIDLPDLSYENFSKEFSANSTKEILAVVARSLLQSASVNTSTAMRKIRAASAC
eukprot:TRINITY_DN37319_c0_g1_i1.p1 TRINITY_DN37319_c0_g1~~TRINITY_DN37319_c0_g1_i1.p1  ORF type:complete len:346 (-),score=49.00 TRINITY_DN37319_c0_g1_i1:8-1006(-)